MSILPASWTSEAIKNTAQTVGIVIATIWGIYTFVYQANIAPASLPPNIVVTPEIAVVGSQGSAVCLSIRVRIRNAGHRRAYLLASGFTVLGLHVLPNTDTLAVARATQAIRRSSRAYGDFQLSGPRLLAVGPLTPQGYWLDDGEEFVNEFLVYAAAGRYDAARLTVTVKIATEFPAGVVQVWDAVGDSTELWPNTAILHGRDTISDPHTQEMQRVRKRYKFAYVQESDETSLWDIRSRSHD